MTLKTCNAKYLGAMIIHKTDRGLTTNGRSAVFILLPLLLKAKYNPEFLSMIFHANQFSLNVMTILKADKRRMLSSVQNSLQ